MKKQLLAFLAICGIASIISCKEGPKTPEPAKGVTINTLNFNKMDGNDCEKPDTMRVDCATINLTWPKVEDGPEPLKQSVAAWADDYLSSILVGYDTLGNPIKTNGIEAAAVSFFQTRKEYAQDAEGSPMGNWLAESSDTVLLNDGQHLTLEIVAFTFEGGAHGSPTAAVATFENSTGKLLSWDDLVTDTSAMKAIAEQNFRKERADIFAPTDGSEPFQFDDIFQFKLPDNYGLTKEGIFCYYLAYEVGPYAIGETVFTIPFADIAAISKIKL